MALYAVDGRILDSEKQDERIAEMHAFFCDCIDDLLSAKGCDRTTPSSWVDTEMDVVFSFVWAPRSRRDAQGLISNSSKR